MRIYVNGAEKEVAENTTVLQFLQENKKDSEKAVVEYNQTILMTEEYGKTVLNEGDRLEILVFVGGG